jgi:hypothetical protein
MSLQTYILPLKKKAGYSLSFAESLKHYVKKNYGEKYVMQYEIKKNLIFKKKQTTLRKRNNKEKKF